MSSYQPVIFDASDETDGRVEADTLAFQGTPGLRPTSKTQNY
jgi:hypothetical protein